MQPPRSLLRFTLLALGLVLLALALAVPTPLQAQDRPPERQMRAYIPPDQLVSFRPSTPLDQFIEFVNPIFERVTGKRVVDPEERTEPIGVTISGMYFFDALEAVLQAQGLEYREADRFFFLEEPLPEDGGPGAVLAGAPQGAAQQAERPATAATREIVIDAVLFDLNLTKARELGIDWTTIFGQAGGGGGGGASSGGGGGGQGGRGGGNQPRFFLDTEELFDDLGPISGPSQIELSTLTQLFRVFENEGAGETIANPTVTVQSGEEGRIQVGADIPVQTRDFSGNTITQFFSTGIIVNVVPTLIAEEVEREEDGASETVEFVHLDVQVENSSSNPSPSGPVISRNAATTQVLLLDGEQTIIGGLYSTDESVNRRGVPLLKDLPGWFFGLRYVFGYEQSSVSQRELLIVLQAKVVDPLQVRARQPFETDLIEERRGDVRENIRRVGEEAYDKARLPEPPDEEGQQ